MLPWWAWLLVVFAAVWVVLSAYVAFISIGDLGVDSLGGIFGVVLASVTIGAVLFIVDRLPTRRNRLRQATFALQLELDERVGSFLRVWTLEDGRVRLDLVKRNKLADGSQRIDFENGVWDGELEDAVDRVRALPDNAPRERVLAAFDYRAPG